MVKSGGPATDFGLRGWASVTTIFITACGWLRSNLTYGERFGIAVHSILLPATPSSPGHAGSRFGLGCHSSPRWQPFFFTLILAACCGVCVTHAVGP
jgi:hypothetical protein